MTAEERAPILEAARTYARGSAHALDVAMGRDISVRELGPYRVGSERSFFADMLWSAGGEDQLRGQIPPPYIGDVAAARKRLSFATERRDLSVTAGAGGDFALNFTPTAAPGYVGAAFAAAVRAKAVVAGLLHHEKLPPHGVKIETTRLTTGAAAAVQTSDNSAVQETDIVEALVTSNVATIAGQQDVSQQLLDRADPGSSIDLVLARDLGNALGLELDKQILNGAGSAGQLRGFINVSGITSVTKTNGAPTGLTNLLALGDLAAQTAAAYGQLPDTLLVAPRRLAYMRSKLANQIEWPVANVVSTPALHTTDGASTNQDEAFAIVADEVWLFGGEPRFRVMLEVGSATLTARFVADMYAGLLAHRMPAAIGRLSGSEFTAPVFT